MINLKVNKKAFDFHYSKVNELFLDILSKKYFERGKPRQKKYLSELFLNFLKDHKDNIISAIKYNVSIKKVLLLKYLFCTLIIPLYIILFL